MRITSYQKLMRNYGNRGLKYNYIIAELASLNCKMA